VSALIAGGLIAGAVIWELRLTAVVPIARFAITPPEGERFNTRGRRVVAISPDGTQMVYVANSRLYHRNLSELDWRPIPGTETWQEVLNPVFSPDGHSIVFWASSDGTLKKIAVSGGASVTLCAVEAPLGISWGENGILVGQGNNGIYRISENGGKPEVLIKPESGILAIGPEFLPGGDALLYTAIAASSASGDRPEKIFVQSLKTGSARKLLIDGGADARYVSTGHIVYASQGTLFAAVFDLKRLQVMGGPVPVVEGVRRTLPIGTAQFSFSKTGSLLYVTGPALLGMSSERNLAVLDPLKGGVEQLKTPPRAYAFPRVSPNGKQAAVSTDDKDANVWIVDLAGDTAPRQLTLGGANRYPVWSADGMRVAFQSDREGDSGIWWQKADGTGTAERLTKAEAGTSHVPDSWSPDGKNFAYTIVKDTELAEWIFSVADKKSTLFAEQAGLAAFSPDGHWLVYQSRVTNFYQVFVQPFPPTGTNIRAAGIESGPLFRPRRSPQSDELATRRLTQRAMYDIQMSYLQRLPGAMHARALPSGETIQQCVYSPHSIRATTATLLLDAREPLRRGCGFSYTVRICIYKMKTPYEGCKPEHAEKLSLRLDRFASDRFICELKIDGWPSAYKGLRGNSIMMAFWSTVVLAILLTLSAINGLAQSTLTSTITTYAGPGLPISGAQAVGQPIDFPNAVVPDTGGGFYVVSHSQSRVYYIASNGALRVTAGTGTPGFSGDGGPAASAQLNGPTGAALDGAGNLFIADTYNDRIRKVTTDGVISTVAGTGIAGFGGDGGPASLARMLLPLGIV
jgi:Tol biopolymer transport system component